MTSRPRKGRKICYAEFLFEEKNAQKYSEKQIPDDVVEAFRIAGPYGEIIYFARAESQGKAR